MRILAVDDDEMILEILAETIGQLGPHEVSRALCAREAAQMIATADRPYDCFLLDIQMPEIDGIDLCAWIRQQPQHVSTPVIMVTAMTDRSFVTRAFAAGATDYVTKPFDTLDLSARIGMAERLVMETRRAAENVIAATALRDQLERERQIDLSEAITIEGIDRVIGMVNMENYLLQLSRGGLLSTNILAIKVDHVERLYMSSTAADFRFLLTDIAEAISIGLEGSDHFISYAGRGIFISLVHGRAMGESEPYADRTRLELEQMAPTNSRGEAYDLHLTFAEPIRVGMMRAGTAAVDALRVAIRKVEELSARNEGDPGTTPPQRRGLLRGFAMAG